ncbi:hypothetical protein ACHAWF_005629 [Thalassiosira exigua]
MATNGSSPPAPPPATLRRRTMRRVALLVALAAFIVVPTRSFPSTAMWSSSSSLRSSSSNRGGRTLGPVGPATSSPSASARARAGTLAGRSIRPRDAREPWRLRSSVDGNEGSQSDGGGGGGGRRSPRRKPRLPSKNLYDILGADPSMSRTEIKRLYLSLARETHPDAAPSNRGADGLAVPSDGGGRFNEVSQAWTILSDPRTRRAYDRDVAAEALKSDVVRRASEAAREYGPAARSLFEDVAIPFLRRTTTTAVAGWDAVTAEAGASGGAATPSEVAGEASELEDFGRAFQRVIEAGRNATRRVDGMELREKSEELRRRSVRTEKAAAWRLCALRLWAFGFRRNLFAPVRQREFSTHNELLRGAVVAPLLLMAAVRGSGHLHQKISECEAHILLTTSLGLCIHLNVDWAGTRVEMLSGCLFSS